MQTVLIFPAVTPEAREYYRQATTEGRAVLAAASVMTDRAHYENWEFLPAVNDAAFPQAFADLVQQHSIDALFVPVASAHFFLKRFLAEKMPQLRIINPSPFEAQAKHFAALLENTDHLLPFERSIAEGRSRLTRLHAAAILQQAMSVHGESNEEKLAAMMGIFARAPQGDVVEVGSLMGRTAIVLRLLADHYDIGNVLTVDPWAEAGAIQRDSPAFVQDMAYAWSPGVIQTGFSINLLALGAKHHAHLQLASTQAHAEYVHVDSLPSLNDHAVAFSHRIAVLHIDANHDYDQVRNDWQLWGQHLVPGGWVIFDDYVWLHGDGPRRMADSLLAERIFDEAFACGKALFCRLAPAGAR